MFSSRRSILAVLALSLIALPCTPGIAAPAPSKSRPGQSVGERQADLASIQEFLDRDDVRGALAARGLSEGEISDRLARLSDQDVASIADNLDQVQAAGAMNRDTMWIVIYILLGVLLIVLLV